MAVTLVFFGSVVLSILMYQHARWLEASQLTAATYWIPVVYNAAFSFIIVLYALSFSHRARLRNQTGKISDTKKALEKEIADRRRIEETLRESRNQMNHLNQLKEKLLAPADLDEKLKYITDAVVKIIDADFARIWIIKPGDRCDSGCIHSEIKEGPHICKYRQQCLHLLASSGRYTHTDGKVHRRVPFGCYKIGRVAAGTDSKFITNDAAHDQRVHNHEWAKELGLASFAGYRLIAPDGKPIGVLALFSKHTITPADDTLLESIAGTTSQVILTTRAEEGIRQAASQWKATFDSVGDMISIHDPDFSILNVNKAFADMIGTTPEEIIGKKCHELLHGTQEPFHTCPHKQVLETKKPVTKEYFEPQLGIPMEVSVSPIVDENNAIIGTVHIAKDITERRQIADTLENSNRALEVSVKKLKEMNAELKDFVYIASHDLREPMRKISSFGELLSESLDGKLEEDDRENLSIMIDGANRMAEMIDGLLLYSRISATNVPAEAVDLNGVIDQLKQLELAALYEESGATIEIMTPLPEVWANPAHMRQLFQNLITNAIKFVPEGRRPQIRIRTIQQNDGTIRVEVQDNGIGIDEQYREKIFAMFRRLHPKRKYEGHGIGLAVCKKIVEKHGGRIGVTSKCGEGSTFWFTLRLAKQAFALV